MENEMSSVFYVKYIMSYPCEKWDQPVEVGVNGALERA